MSAQVSFAVNDCPRNGARAMPGGGTARGWCGDVWMQNRVTPSESCRSAMCLRVRGVHDQGLSNDVNASLPTHFLPCT